MTRRYAEEEWEHQKPGPGHVGERQMSVKVSESRRVEEHDYALDRVLSPTSWARGRVAALSKRVRRRLLDQLSYSRRQSFMTLHCLASSPRGGQLQVRLITCRFGGWNATNFHGVVW